MDLSKRTKSVWGVAALYVLGVLVLRYAGSGTSWWVALSAGAVLTPLALWMGWLRSRLREQAAEFGRRRTRPWPEERRRR
ncbi:MULTISPECIES: hypothetical protein [unclassified Streptomyces]|uniref:hypothetical protein n=1 Tax=unclassified Streptomyces TaxID=2593676 RepID=UPI001CBBAE77|nr:MULTISPECIES: hypothetical protein [unclassified Streptomyces]WPO71785.1 hypothetical protein R9806_14680 [Streptomyces sp. KN37]